MSFFKRSNIKIVFIALAIVAILCVGIPSVSAAEQLWLHHDDDGMNKIRNTYTTQTKKAGGNWYS
ncbi:MAG TPA: hypothetical protein VLF89_07660, partial [Candidatus Saccharimonadales bacterium]|nr:hypothetical protein [Candidatus Saccharimonadales bacterium]